MTVTRRDAVKTLAAIPLGGALLSLTGCKSEATVVELLITAISDAAAIAEPQFAALITGYATKATNFVESYVMERASGDTPAEQYAKIEAAAAAVVLPNLSGVPAEIVTKLNAIAPLIAVLVDSIKALNAAIEKTPGGANAFFADPKHKKLKPMTAEQRAKANAQIAALKAKLAAAPKGK